MIFYLAGFLPLPERIPVTILTIYPDYLNGYFLEFGFFFGIFIWPKFFGEIFQLLDLENILNMPGFQKNKYL